MKVSEWTNIKRAIRKLLNFIDQVDEDDIEIKEDLERWLLRVEKPNPNRELLSEAGRNILAELDLRPMPANQEAKERIPGQAAIHGCPEDPCIGKQHCSICGLHGKRKNDGHEHIFKRVDEED